MTPLAIERVFGRDRLKMVTGRYVEVFREAAAPGERRRYTKRFLSGADGDYTQWTGREWRLLARLVGHGVRHVPEIVLFDRGQSDSAALVQTYDAGVTVDHWATLLPVRRDGQVLRHVFRDCAHWWALAENFLLALREIHQLQLVHLDIKADNVCIPLAPTLFNPHVPGELLFPAFEQLALIDFAFSLVTGERLDTPLPIGAQPEFAYQSPRLLHALSAGRRGDMRPTHELDWRCDMYSLAALLGRLLPPPERVREARPADGWTADRYGAAKALLLDIRDAHDREATRELPHDRLLASTRAVLRHRDMTDSLERGWTLATWSNSIEALEPSAPPTPLTRVELPTQLLTLVEERVADDARASPAQADAMLPTVPLPGAVPVVEIELRVPTDLAPVRAETDTRPPTPPLPPAAPAAEIEPRASTHAPLPAVAGSDGSVAARSASEPVARADIPPGASPLAPREAAAVPTPAFAPAPLPARGSAPAPAPAPAPALAPAPAPAPASATTAAVAAEGPTLPRHGAAATPRRRLGKPLGYAAAAVAAVGLLAVLAHVASPERERTRPPVATARPPATDAGSATVPGIRPDAPEAMPGTARAEATPPTTAASAAGEPAPQESRALREVARLPGAASSGATTATDAAAAVPPADMQPKALPPAVAPPTAASPAAVPAAVVPPAAATMAARPPPATGEPAAPAGDTVPDPLLVPGRQAAAQIDRVLRAAARAEAPSQDKAVLEHIGSLGPTLRRQPVADAGAQRARARRFNASARKAFWSRRDAAEALALQRRAFEADPLDPEIAGNLAFYHLKVNPPQPEAARRVALHALAAAPQAGMRRMEDWGSLAVASALTGRPQDAADALFVMLTVSRDLDRTCHSALNMAASYGPRLKPPVEALFARIHARGRDRDAPHCAWPPRWSAGQRYP